MSPVRVDALRALATTLLVGSVCLGPSPARGQADPAQQRARIAADRAQADAVLADRDRACLPQFVVAPCRAAARNEQRATLTRLRREEMALDEAERNANAARRREALADKAAARQARSAAADASAAQRAQAPAVAPRIEPAAPAAKERAERSTRARRAPRAPPETTRPAPGHADHAGRRSALEAKNIAAFEARARAAQAHRDAVASRTARRLQGSEGDQGVNAVRRSAPLPTPPAPAVPVAGVVAGAVAGAGASAPVAASRPAR